MATTDMENIELEYSPRVNDPLDPSLHSENVPKRRPSRLYGLICATATFCLFAPSYVVNLTLKAWQDYTGQDSFGENTALALVASNIVACILCLVSKDLFGRVFMYIALVASILIQIVVLFLSFSNTIVVVYVLYFLFFLSQLITCCSQIIMQRVTIAVNEKFLPVTLLFIPISGIMQFGIHYGLNKWVSIAVYLKIVFAISASSVMLSLFCLYVTERKEGIRIFAASDDNSAHGSNECISKGQALKIAFQSSYPSFISIFTTMTSLSLIMPIVVLKIVERNGSLDYFCLTGLVQCGEVLGRLMFITKSFGVIPQKYNMIISIVRTGLITVYILAARGVSFFPLAGFLYTFHVFFCYTFGWLLTSAFQTATESVNQLKVKAACSDIAIITLNAAIAIATFFSKYVLKPLI